MTSLPKVYIAPNNRGAFTLVEFLAVFVVISVLSALIITGLHHTMAKAKLAECAQKLKNIHQAVQNYSIDWKWTNPSGDAYPAMSGFPLFGDAVFSQSEANQVKDFLCSVSSDSKAVRYLTTGYRSSFQLASSFIGFNQMDSGGPPVIVINHMAKRHSCGKTKTAIYMYSDGHWDQSTCSPNEAKYMPGLSSRWWNIGGYNTSPAGNPSIELVWSENMARRIEDGLFFLPRGTYDPLTPAVIPIPNWDLSAVDEPDNVMGVWEGYLDFPSAGAWTIFVLCDNSGGFGVDDNEDGVVAGGEIRGPAAGPSETAYGIAIPNPGRHAVKFFYFEGLGQHSFQFSWNGPGTDKEVIPIGRLSHLP